MSAFFDNDQARFAIAGLLRAFAEQVERGSVAVAGVENRTEIVKEDCGTFVFTRVVHYTTLSYTTAAKEGAR